MVETIQTRTSPAKPALNEAHHASVDMREHVLRDEITYRFIDDPLYREELYEKMVGFLLREIEEKYSNKRVIFNALKFKVALLNRVSQKPLPSDLIDSLSEYATTLAEPHVDDAVVPTDELVRNLSYLALFDSRVLEKVDTTSLRAVGEFIADERTVLLGFNTILLKLIEGTVSIDQTGVKLLSAKSINPMLTWAMQHLYADLDARLAMISCEYVRSEKMRKQLIEAIAVMGYLMGYLDKTHPDAQKYACTLRQYVQISELPGVVVDALKIAEKTSTTQPLDLLKGYWHKVFVQKWMAVARLKGRGVTELSLVDKNVGQGMIGGDLRSADSLAGARTQKIQQYFQTDNWKLAELVEHEYVMDQSRLDRQVDESKKKLRRYTEQLIRAYSPDVKFVFDQRGNPVGPWSVLQKKAGMIFEVFVRAGVGLRSDVSFSAQQHILANMVDAIKGVLAAGNGENNLTTAKLFGSKFDSLAPIEQCSLLIFTCLTLSVPQTDQSLAVTFISQTLQKLLQQHFPASPEEVEYVSGGKKSPPFVLEEQSVAVKAARERLEQLTPKDGIVSIQNEQVRVEIEEKYELLSVLKKVMEKRSNEVVPMSRAIIYFFALFTLGFAVAIDAKMQHVALFATFALMNFRSTYRFLRRLGVDTKVVNNMKQLELFEKELVEDIERIAGQSRRRLKLMRKWFAISTMVVLLMSPAVNTVYKATSDLLPTIFPSQSSGGISLENFSIPDLMDQDALRTLEHQFRGTIMHLPDNFTGESGEVIGYQPGALVDVGGQRYKEIHAAPMIAVKYVDDFTDEIDQAASDELVYEVADVSDVIHPLQGWEIVKVYQVDGGHPLMGASGTLYYPDELPSRVAIVARKRQSQVLSSGGEVQQYDGLKAETTYMPWLNWPQMHAIALELNARLAPDPILQQLHLRMVNDVDALVNSFSTSQVSVEEMNVMYSDLGLRHAILFADWVNGRYVPEQQADIDSADPIGRYYSLLFDGSKSEGQYGVLLRVAEQPKSGYYCGVGGDTFQQYFSSIGIQVLLQPGNHVKNYEEKLYSRIGHVNTIIILPDGRFINFEPTPQRPADGEDLSALNDFPPDGNKDQPNVLFPAIGLVLLGAGAGVHTAQRVRRRKVARREGSVDDDIFSEVRGKESVARALEHILVYLEEIADPEKLGMYIGPQKPHLDKYSLLHSLAFDAVTLLKHSTPAKSQTTSFDRMYERLQQMDDKVTEMVRADLGVVVTQLKRLEQGEKNSRLLNEVPGATDNPESADSPLLLLCKVTEMLHAKMLLKRAH